MSAVSCAAGDAPAEPLYLVPLAGTRGGDPRQLTSGEVSQSGPGVVARRQDDRLRAGLDRDARVRDQVQPDLYVLTVADGAIRRLATASRKTATRLVARRHDDRVHLLDRPRRGERCLASSRRPAEQRAI